jgi:hypothetical protein
LLARFCRERTGRACLLCPGISDVDLFRYREGVIHLNAKVSDGAFDLGVGRARGCTARKLPVRR